MGKTARLFITLPAELWAIALKSLVFLDRRLTAEEEATLKNYHERLQVVEPVLARKSGVSQYATRQHSFENERISKRVLDRRRRDDPECTSELSANQKRTEPPPPLSSLMAGKEQPGRLLVRTFMSRRRGHDEMWPSTCSQGFEARACANPGPIYREGSE
ncbi:hypothetical protein ALC56_08334 [Trachymyrmex septentrionalis]|uniref:Uncharacterized protein n=1 Tax=Trachymyrmex septentrionalis TaxID=34720 RepID=A0A195FAN9_9HYME|nr:hypothetical protein ALC56_08334 [Trachymyrmex septentrionalis]